jgi:hypothetical protein
MLNQGLVKNYTCQGAIPPRTIVKYGTADYTATQAGTNMDAFLGISDTVGGNDGDRIDIVRTGMTELVLGGNVTRGDHLTSDANGNGITAAPAAGANMETIGTAEMSGVPGDIIPVLVVRARIQG